MPVENNNKVHSVAVLIEKGTQPEKTVHIDIERYTGLLTQYLNHFNAPKRNAQKMMDCLAKVGREVEKSYLSQHKSATSLPKFIKFQSDSDKKERFRSSGVYKAINKMDYTVFLTLWCLRNQKDDTKTKRSQKLSRPSGHIPRSERRRIKLGLHLVDELIIDGRVSHCIQEFKLEAKRGIQDSSDIDKYKQAVADLRGLIQSYRTLAQRILKYLNYVLAGTGILCGIGFTVALFTSLLAPWPVLAASVCLLMIAANGWVSRFRTNGDNTLANVLGYGGLELTKWVNPAGKTRDLSARRKVMLCFGVILSAISSANMALLICTFLLNLKIPFLFFLTYPPVALLLAIASFMSSMKNSLSQCSAGVRIEDPWYDLIKKPFDNMEKEIKNSQASKIRQNVVRVVTYGLFVSFTVLGAFAILLVAYVGIPFLISQVLIPMGFVMGVANVIGYTLSGLLACLQLPFLIQTTSAVCVQLVKRMHRLSDSTPEKNKEHNSWSWDKANKEWLIPFFQSCLFVQEVLRVFNTTKSPHLKTRRFMICSRVCSVVAKALPAGEAPTESFQVQICAAKEAIRCFDQVEDVSKNLIENQGAVEANQGQRMVYH